ncbi:MAG: aminotransferase class V-fold PLP-dependent enzyme [Candidatus Marinimicrobia bacterium]|nr:aminotransferase class V-fold PLP-dependent enzyme [Candidatus Neomarinimicrobiota bacterium]
MKKTTRSQLDYCQEKMDAAFADFQNSYPAFKKTDYLDKLRKSEYSRLDTNNQIYLDYTGGSQYADSQLSKHLELLRQGIFGNPHSNNPSSLASTALVEHARASVFEFFNASPEEYVAIFTANATGAIKLVAESYPFSSNSKLLLTFDNHNSVNGIREFAHAKNATVNYVPILPPDLRVDIDKLTDHLDRSLKNGDNLFIYPSQSNYSGVQHPLEWITLAQDKGWDVMIDSAAFAPTNRLDLNKWHPDFVPISFYKMFGYPTGVGCLLARKKALNKLHRPWFSGGTITISTVQGEEHYLADGEAGFEDGTVNYLTLPAVEIGLKHIANIGIETIHERVTCLTGWLLKQLLSLHHRNGKPLIRIYGPIDLDMRGGAIALNFYDPQEILIDYRQVEALTNEANISLRTGCFCNPGVSESIHGLTEKELKACFRNKERMTFDQFLTVLNRKNGKSAGSIRISLGLVTNFPDVYLFIQFVQRFLNNSA